MSSCLLSLPFTCFCVLCMFRRIRVCVDEIEGPDLTLWDAFVPVCLCVYMIKPEKKKSCYHYKPSPQTGIKWVIYVVWGHNINIASFLQNQDKFLFWLYLKSDLNKTLCFFFSSSWSSSHPFISILFTSSHPCLITCSCTAADKHT